MAEEAKRNYKDSLFRTFFREPENFIPTAETVTHTPFAPSCGGKYAL